MATVFIGNLAPDVTDADIRELFNPFGRITSVRVNSRRRLAFVELEAEAAAKAVDELRGKQLHDRTMDISLEGGGGGRRGGGRPRGRRRR